MSVTKIGLFLMTFLVLVNTSWSQRSSCKSMLDISTPNELYLRHKGPRYKTSFASHPTDLLMMSDKTNKLLVRDLLSKTLEPIFIATSELDHDSIGMVQAWLIKHKPLVQSILVFPSLKTRKDVTGFERFKQGFDKKFEYEMFFSGIWSRIESEDEFTLGLDQREAHFMRQLATSFYYMASRFNDVKIRHIFESSFKKADLVLEHHSYSETNYAYMMDIVFISYMHAITLLNVRPQVQKYLQMTNSDWLNELLAPQPGEKLSLVEKLAMILRPEVLGNSGLSLFGLTDPLVVKDGKLSFSPQMKNLFKISNDSWLKQNGPLEPYQTGLGCPAGICPVGQTESSISKFNRTLLKIFNLIETVGINPEDFYEPQFESTYILGEEQKHNLKNK